MPGRKNSRVGLCRLAFRGARERGGPIFWLSGPSSLWWALHSQLTLIRYWVGSEQGRLVGLWEGSRAGKVCHVLLSSEDRRSWCQLHGRVPTPPPPYSLPRMYSSDGESFLERRPARAGRCQASPASPRPGLHLPLLSAGAVRPRAAEGQRAQCPAPSELVPSLTNQDSWGLLGRWKKPEQPLNPN